MPTKNSNAIFDENTFFIPSEHELDFIESALEEDVMTDEELRDMFS